VPVEEGLHSFVCWQGSADYLSVADVGDAFEDESYGLLQSGGGGSKLHSGFVFVGGYSAAGEREAFGSVFQSDADGIGEAVFADGVDGDVGGCARADVEC